MNTATVQKSLNAQARTLTTRSEPTQYKPTLLKEAGGPDPGPTGALDALELLGGFSLSS